jgi:hypothetical protein
MINELGPIELSKKIGELEDSLAEVHATLEEINKSKILLSSYSDSNMSLHMAYMSSLELKAKIESKLAMHKKEYRDYLVSEPSY